MTPWNRAVLGVTLGETWGFYRIGPVHVPCLRVGSVERAHALGGSNRLGSFARMPGMTDVTAVSALS